MSRRNDRGIALISALWGSAILAVIALSVLQLTRADARVTRGRVDTVALNAAADGIINLAILTLLDPGATQPPVDGTPVAMTFAGHEAQVSVQDETGKIDVNMASENTLAQVLASVGAEAEAARRIAAAIVTWRQPASVYRRGTGLAEEYRATGATYEPRHSLFQSVEELQLVLGMPPDLYRRAAPLLTVYSQTAYIEPSLASVPVLAVFRNQSQTADAMLRRREEEAAGSRPRQPSYGVALGHAFTITADLRGADGARVRRQAVVRLTARPQSPLLVYRWN
ncbi:MAG: hypothetical protein WDN25_26160 [Acetobacteraceae bacterium]